MLPDLEHATSGTLHSMSPRFFYFLAALYVSSALQPRIGGIRVARPIRTEEKKRSDDSKAATEGKKRQYKYCQLTGN